MEAVPEETPLSEHHHQVTLPDQQQVSPDEHIPITKEEEWIKRKKVEVVTKRQIATRVQREVVLEDGKVVQDSGPKVTTTTTEDTEKQESENTEHHDIGEAEGDGSGLAVGHVGDLVEGWAATGAGEPALLTEVREKKVTTREETQETVETEDVKHLGDISDEAYRRAVESGDVGEALVRAAALEVAPVGPRIVGHTTRVHKVTDTEDSLKTSGVDSTGKIVTNTTTRKEHEEVREEDVPDGAGGEPTEEFVKEKSHHFTKTKDQEFVDYVADGVKIGTEMRYNAETSEGTRVGDGEWDSLSERLNKMRRGRFLKESDQDRKDALTRCPLDFDQEEKTRKAETSKWLEHHFGSESNSRSSRDSDDDNLHQTQSYINVTMKSAKDPSKGPAHTNGKVFLSSPEPTEKVYFKGISEWKSEDRKYPMGRVQVLPTGPNHTFNSSGSKSPSPPLQLPNGGSPVHHHHAIHNKYPSAQNLLERRSHSSSNSPLHHSSSTERYTTKTTTTTKYFGQERNGSPYGRSSPMYSGRGTSPMPAVQSKLNNGKATPPTREHTPPRMSPPQRRRTRRTERDEEGLREEPAPDYSPVSEPRSSPHRITPDVKRKVYQRTRFAADIPPPSSHQQQHGPSGGGSGGKSGKRGGLGQSFRRLVGKLRSSSGERKKKGKKSGGEAEEHQAAQHRVVDSGTQTAADMHTIQRYYLGEDPFGGSSMYGRESEYDGVNYRRKYRREEDRQHSSSQGSSTLGRLSKSTSRLSGGGGSATSSDHHRPLQNGVSANTLYYPANDRGGVQTLPRKLQENKIKKEVHVTRSNGENSFPDRSNRLGQNSSSMFNVSIVNNVSSPSPTGGYAPNGGPVKPARTYRSNLLRSKSFNVHQAPPGPGHHWASPGVQRLEGGHAPLKSPGIVTSISRSTKDLAEALHQEEDNRASPRIFDQNRYSRGQNGLHSRNNVDSKKKIFMKALMERAPELYRTLHGPEEEVHQRNGTSYTTSTPVKQSYHYRSSPTHLDRVHSPTGYNMSNGSATDLSRSVVRRGSNDYTETVTFTKKSDDPNRPTVTNTVQSYTKKMVPTPGGGTRRETIESTETKTVTKSRFRTATPELKYLEHDPNKYSTGNGGVIIEVRNTRK